MMEMKFYHCKHCGHIVVGTNAPEECPVCNHPKGFEVHNEIIKRPMMVFYFHIVNIDKVYNLVYNIFDI